MHRREFLKGAGVAAAMGAGATSWYAYDRGVFSVGEGPAYTPWKEWRAEAGQGPLALIRAALLAASPHNTQPWRFKAGESSIELHLDRQRNVGALDPYLREEHIGMGCALENLLLAAPANGYAAKATLVTGNLSGLAQGPQSEVVARVDLSSGSRNESELYKAIPKRHTNRSLFDRTRALAAHFLEALRRVADAEENVRLYLFTGEAERRQIVQLSSAANTELYSDPQVAAASERWLRLKWSDVQKFRDGLTIDAFGLPPITSALAKTLPTAMLSHIATQSQKSGYAERMMAAPLIGMIAVRDRYQRDQCLQAGQVWQRAHLLATAHGVGARPGNEAMEMVDYERMLGRPASCLKKLSAVTGDSTWQPTFVFLMGHPTETANASPRRSIQEVLYA